MHIKKIRVTNFKSFKDLEIELGRFNVIIGANASGKSNFVQIFKFLRDTTIYGLDNAISMQGGVDYLRNINIGSSKELSLEIVSDLEYGKIISHAKEREGLGVRTFETIYKMALGFKKNGREYEIIEDKITQRFKIIRLGIKGKNIEEKEIIGKGWIILSHTKGRIKIDSFNISEGIPINKNDIIPQFILEERLDPQSPLIILFPLLRIPLFFNKTLICDFDPRMPKRATTVTGKAEIEEDGSNLAIVLKNILEDREKRRKLFNLITNILPFVNNMGVEKLADKSLLFKIEEIYTKKGNFLPASSISDGTINVTTLIVALYFERKWMTIIEEPERNIHPYLISKVVEMMKDASRNKQVIITTHNPEIVKYAGLENILLVSRDRDGFSIITKPSMHKEVKIFLKNELGIEDLFIQNLLG